MGATYIYVRPGKMISVREDYIAKLLPRAGVRSGVLYFLFITSNLHVGTLSRRGSVRARDGGVIMLSRSRR